LGELAEDVERDRETLVEIMKRLSVGRDRLKILVSWGPRRQDG